MNVYKPACRLAPSAPSRLTTFTTHRFSSQALVVFTLVLGLLLAATPVLSVPQRETNAQRLTRGLAPLWPQRLHAIADATRAFPLSQIDCAVLILVFPRPRASRSAIESANDVGVSVQSRAFD
jgi:hypothetical protein